MNPYRLRTSAHGAASVGWCAGVLMCLLVLSPAAATAPMADAAIALSTRSWAGTITAEFWTRVDEPSLVTDEHPDRLDTMTVAYDPVGVVRLGLGSLCIEASPGRLSAWHVHNDKVVYEATHPGSDLADVLKTELPPLWCPWLAIALSGTDSAWPLVGAPGGDRVVWDDAVAVVEQQPVTTLLCSGRAASGKGLFGAVVKAPQQKPGERSGGAVLSRYSVVIDQRGGMTLLSFTYEPIEPPAWPKISVEGRVRVASVAALAPSPAEIGVGDRIPRVRLSSATEINLAVRTWLPVEAFLVDGAGRRPVALALAMVRPGADAEAVLFHMADSIRRARRSATDGASGVLSRPVIATRTREVERTILTPLRRSWEQGYRPDPILPEAEARVPAFSWCPYSMLLGRVAPGSDASIVVIDRSGWIVGVHAWDAQPDDIANSIRAAAR